jgi:nucleoside-diphosphate-sugar epimerase
VKILLTGATGFIGSHVARALVHAGHEVHAVIRPNANPWRITDILPSLHIISGDLLNSSFILHPSSFDVCLHLAWYVEPGKYLESPLNRGWVDASLHFARALQTAGCRRFVAAGTCFEYAESSKPLREDSQTGPRTLYAQSKLQLLNALQDLDIEVGWVRFFYQYGPFEDPRRLVPAVINALLRGDEAKLTPGERRLDYLHIEDVASAVAVVAASTLTGPVNIGSATPVTVLDIGLKIGELLGRPELIKPGALPYGANEPMHIVADNSKLRTTGWRPRFTLETGLGDTIEWWRQHPPAKSSR